MSPNAAMRLRFMRLVAAHSVFVVKIVFTTSSKKVGERSTRPRASFFALRSFGSLLATL